VTVRVGEWTAEVDKALAPLIKELWRAGWPTSRSCQAHFETGLVWVEFRDPYHVEEFVKVVAPHDPASGSLWARAVMWGFGNLGAEPIPHGEIRDKTDAWIYHVSWGLWGDTGDEADCELQLMVNVLFPRGDLKAVTERMRAYNKHLATDERTGR